MMFKTKLKCLQCPSSFSNIPQPVIRPLMMQNPLQHALWNGSIDEYRPRVVDRLYTQLFSPR